MAQRDVKLFSRPHSLKLKPSWLFINESFNYKINPFPRSKLIAIGHIWEDQTAGSATESQRADHWYVHKGDLGYSFFEETKGILSFGVFASNS